MEKLHDWFKSYVNFARLGRLVVEFNLRELAANTATLSNSNCRKIFFTRRTMPIQ